MKNNSINSVPGYSSALPLTGVRLVRVSYNTGSLPSGTTNLYTVPAGKRAIIGEANIFNSNIGSPTILYSTQIIVGGTPYHIRPANTSIAVQIQQAPGSHYIAEAGETLSITTNNAGLNAWFKIIEFDANTSIFSQKLIGTVTGDNIIYTVPTGKTAMLIGQALEQPAYLSGIYASNNSGASVTLDFYVVPSGQSVGSQYKAAASISFAVGTAGIARTAVASLSSGDAIVVTASVGAAGHLLWVNVLEV